MAGSGAATADFVYAILAVVAGATLALGPALYALWLRIAGAVVLLLLGGFGWWQTWHIEN